MTDRGQSLKSNLQKPLLQVQKEIGDLLGLLQRGGPGSGHHGHAGRPGEVGGSAPSRISVGVDTSTLTTEQRDAGEHVIFMWGERPFTHLEPGKFWIVPDGRISGEMPDHGMAISFTRAFSLGFVRSLYSPSNNEIFFDFQGGALTEAAKDSIEFITHSYSRRGVIIAADVQNPNWEPGEEAIRILHDADAVMEEIGRTLVTRGGPGSGHHGHAGRPGKVGGSLPSGAMGYRKIPFDHTYATAPIGLRRLAKKEQQETGEFRWAYWDLSDPDDPHTKMFENKEAAMEFVAKKIRKLDYEIHYSFSDATMIFEHTQNKPHSISFNSQDVLALIELSKRPENTNIMNMHNHPPQKSGIDIPPSFSDFDFAMSQQKTDEWWVVTPNGKYVVTREERGIPYFASADVYQLRDDWNKWTEQNLGNYFPGYDPKHSIQLKASRDPEAGKKYVEMRMELIQKEVEDGGYFNMEWLPNE